MRLEVLITKHDDGSWAARAVAPVGTIVTVAEAMNVLSLTLAQFSQNPSARIMSAPEWAALDAEAEKRRAALVLPDGWEATLDGWSTHSIDGVTAFSRTYRKTEWPEGQSVPAPCAGDGSPTESTAAVLSAVEE